MVNGQPKKGADKGRGGPVLDPPDLVTISVTLKGASATRFRRAAAAQRRSLRAQATYLIEKELAQGEESEAWRPGMRART